MEERKEVQKKENEELKKEREDYHQENDNSLTKKMKSFFLGKILLEKLVLRNRQELEIKRTEVQESKKESLNMKSLQDKLVQELKDNKVQEIQDLNLKCQNAIEELKILKSQTKQKRASNEELDTKCDQQDRDILKLQLKLNQIGNDYQKDPELKHTVVELQEVQDWNRNLKEKLEKLREKKREVQKQTKELKEEEVKKKERLGEVIEEGKKTEWVPQKKVGMAKQLKQVKVGNKEEFDNNLVQASELKEVKGEIQEMENKRLVLIEIANLLRDQNKFERLSTKWQTNIEDLEDILRDFENDYKELQFNLDIIFKEGGSQDQVLNEQLKSFWERSLKLVETKDQIKFQMIPLNKKVCNKSPEELKIDKIDKYFEKLNQLGQSVSLIDTEIQQMKQEIRAIKKSYSEFEQKSKKYFHSKSNETLDEDKDLLKKISYEHILLQESLVCSSQQFEDKINILLAEPMLLDHIIQILSKAKKVEMVLKEAISDETDLHEVYQDLKGHNGALLIEQFKIKEKSVLNQHTNIGEFYGTFILNKEQNERLKRLQSTEIEQLRILLEEYDQDIVTLQSDNTKLRQLRLSRQFINNAESQISSIEIQMNDIEKRIQNYQDLLNNLPYDQELQNELQTYKYNLRNLRDQLGQFKIEIYKLQMFSDEQLQENQSNISLLQKDLKELDSLSLQAIQHDLDLFENKLNQQQRKKEYQQAFSQLKDMFTLENTAEQVKNMREDFKRQKAVFYYTNIYELSIRKSGYYQDERLNNIPKKENKQLIYSFDKEILKGQEIQQQPSQTNSLSSLFQEFKEEKQKSFKQEQQKFRSLYNGKYSKHAPGLILSLFGYPLHQLSVLKTTDKSFSIFGLGQFDTSTELTQSFGQNNTNEQCTKVYDRVTQNTQLVYAGLALSAGLCAYYGYSYFQSRQLRTEKKEI